VPTVRYENSKYGFSLERPKTTTLETAGFESLLSLTQTPVVAVILPDSIFKGTNMFEAGVHIGASSTPAVASKWNVPVADEGEVPLGTTTINGATFCHLLHKGTCLELSEVLHSGEIGNFPPTVVQFDKVTFGGYLEAIVDTFTFE
jgi:hypothetical protein